MTKQPGRCGLHDRPEPCGTCEALDRLRHHVSQLVEQCSTAEWVSGMSRTHRVDSPGLLSQADNPSRASLTRAGQTGGRSAPGSRPPGRWDIMSLTDFVHSKAEKLRKRVRGKDYRELRIVIDSLHDLQVLAEAGTETHLICGQVASWTGTAKVTLGYAEPPAQTNLHCPECKTMLVAPQLERGKRYLSCPNQECVDDQGRRRSWNEYQVPFLKQQQEERSA